MIWYIILWRTAILHHIMRLDGRRFLTLLSVSGEGDVRWEKGERGAVLEVDGRGWWKEVGDVVERGRGREERIW